MMLKFPVQHTLKTFRNPIHNPLYHRLLIRHMHTEVPYLEPASYTNINRRFSSYPSPLELFNKKKSGEASERGEFDDIHDISNIEPNNFDVVITDVSDKTLQTDIAELVGISYLQEANKRLDFASGFLYGINSRPIFPCVVKYGMNNETHWVFFYCGF